MQHCQNQKMLYRNPWLWQKGITCVKFGPAFDPWCSHDKWGNRPIFESKVDEQKKKVWNILNFDSFCLTYTVWMSNSLQVILWQVAGQPIDQGNGRSSLGLPADSSRNRTLWQWSPSSSWSLISPLWRYCKVEKESDWPNPPALVEIKNTLYATSMF